MGVDLNTASASLLSYVSGVSAVVSKILLHTERKTANLPRVLSLKGFKIRAKGI